MSNPAASIVWTFDNQIAGEVLPLVDGFGAFVSDVLIEVKDTKAEAAHAVLGAHFALQWPDTQKRADPRSDDDVCPVR